MCAEVLGQYLGYSSNTLGHTYAMWEAYFSGHMPIMENVCIAVLLVTLLLVVTSNEAYVLTQLSHVCT